MFGRRCSWQASSVFVAIALLVSTASNASQFSVVVDTGSLASTSATLVFDFSDGDPTGPNNEVRLSFGLATSSNTSTSGSDVAFSGSPDDVWVFTDLDLLAMNPRSLYVDFTSLPSSMTFAFSTTDNAPPAGITPDQFALTFLGYQTTSILFPTTDPQGLDALFRFDIDGSAIQGPYGPTATDITEFSVEITPVAQAPEPGVLALLAVGLSAMFARRRAR